MDELEKLDADLLALAEEQMKGPGREQLLPADFDVEAVLDEEATKKRGSPVYRDQEVITIHVGPGDKRKRVVGDEDRRRYAARYVAWKRTNSVEEGLDGFPLAQWATIPGRAVVKAFAHHGIRTVEQLAAATDNVVQAAGPWLALREKARDWVKNAQSNRQAVQLRDALDAAEQRIKALEQMVQAQAGDIAAARAQGGALAPAPAGPDPRMAALEAQMAALVASMQKPAEPVNGAPKRRGRPPKVKPADPGTEA